MTVKAHRDYALIVLMLMLASNYLDRQVLSLLLQEIKVALDLSDTQLGLLSGFAFAIFYALMGVPIAKLADRGNRVTIISIAAALWSVAVALCGAATGFIHLLLIRVMVGVGEAGLSPPAQSLIGDWFGRPERAKAVSIFKLGIPISIIVGYIGAGWLNELVGWRMTFVFVGLPGIVLSILAWMTLKDPRFTPLRKYSGTAVEEPAALRRVEEDLTYREVFSLLWANPTFKHLMVAYSLVILFGAGIGKWQPSFLIRSYGLKTSELGMWMAIIAGGGGLIGMYLGGYLSTRYAARNEPLQLRAMAIAYSMFGLIYLGTFLTTDYRIAFTCMGLALIAGNTVTGPLFGMLLSVVPERMRATSLAIIYLAANLIGGGLGPLLVGALSDLLRMSFGNDSLRIALALCCPGYIWCGVHFWRAARTVQSDLDANEEHVR